MKFQSHTPNFVDADPAVPKQDFENIEAVLAHPWIRNWNKGRADFKYCWDVNDGRWSKAVLMASWIDKDGRPMWWVLGYLDEIPDTLPKMVYPKEGPKK